MGELELQELVGQGSAGGQPGAWFVRRTHHCGARNIPHDQTVARRGELDPELDPERVTVLFCNGPQCPQSPGALRALVEAGYPSAALAYYRAGMHDWVSLAMPTQSA